MFLWRSFYNPLIRIISLRAVRSSLYKANVSKKQLIHYQGQSWKKNIECQNESTTQLQKRHFVNWNISQRPGLTLILKYSCTASLDREKTYFRSTVNALPIDFGENATCVWKTPVRRCPLTFFGWKDTSQSEDTKRIFSGFKSVWVSLQSWRNFTE